MLTDKDGYGLTRNRPIPMKQAFLTQEGYGILVGLSQKGTEAMNVIKNTCEFYEIPKNNMQFVIISLTVRNISTAEEPELISSSFFNLVGSSNIVIHPHIRIQYPDDNECFCNIQAELFHDGGTTGSIVFCVPENETNMCLMWNKAFLDKSSIRYFAVE